MEHTNEPNERWRVQKEKLLRNFSYLTERDFHFDYGMRDVMMTKLQAKLGKSRDELNALLNTL